MKSWLTQGSSGRWVTLPPETTFLQYQWGFIVCLAAVFWNITQRWEKRCVTFQKNGCEGDYWALVVFFVALVATYAPLYLGTGWLMSHLYYGTL